jgi:hypothetical protein
MAGTRSSSFIAMARGLLDLADGSMRQVLDDPSAEEFAWAPDGLHSRCSGHGVCGS